MLFVRVEDINKGVGSKGERGHHGREGSQYAQQCNSKGHQPGRGRGGGARLTRAERGAT